MRRRLSPSLMHIDLARWRETGQGSVEYAAVLLIVAVCLALGASLLPSAGSGGPLPGLISSAAKAALCKAMPVSVCDDGGGTAKPGDDGGDNGDDDGGGGNPVVDFFKGAGNTIKDGFNSGVDGLKQVGGFFKGAGEQGWDTLTGLWDTVTHPKETWEGIKQLAKDPLGSLKTIWDETTKPIVDDWKNGNYGEAIGRGAFSILETVFGGKGLSKLGKANKAIPDKPKTPDKPKHDKPGDDKDKDKGGKDKPGVCPRAWRGKPGGTGHIELYAAPGGTKCPDEARRAELNQQIDDARTSPDAGKRDEGDVAHAIRDNVWDFNRKVGPNGSKGEVDIETQKAIVEVTRGRADGKYKQTTQTLRDPEVNPDGKPVILYIKPGQKRPPSQRIKDLEAAGVKVVRNDDELKQALRDLGENVP